MSSSSPQPTKKQAIILLPPEAAKRGRNGQSHTLMPADRSEIKFVIPGSRRAAQSTTISTNVDLVRTAQPFLDPSILEEKWRVAQKAKDKRLGDSDSDDVITGGTEGSL
ncbi:hypothetical protein BROUX41_005502 [Berkeleyomyces rouxiae]|uniref:uncharacterized protein n=1 Tax=Berkeleyomyces rouxiae TaxID=2035830 RepID=UPI003B806D35